MARIKRFQRVGVDRRLWPVARRKELRQARSGDRALRCVGEGFGFAEWGHGAGYSKHSHDEQSPQGEMNHQSELTAAQGFSETGFHTELIEGLVRVAHDEADDPEEDVNIIGFIGRLLFDDQPVDEQGSLFGGSLTEAAGPKLVSAE